MLSTLRHAQARALCSRSRCPPVPPQPTHLYRAMGASSPSSSLVSTAVPLKELLEVAQKAAAAGAVVVGDALDKPRTVTFKGATDLVTETDKAAEVAVLQYIRREFPHHGVLGEEGGVAGNTASEYLWVVDPIDGTTNFAHSYAGFAVSVGVLHNGKPVAGCVIEFVGGMHAWNTRTYAAHSGGGATCNGKPIHVSSVSTIERSLLVTGFGYEHDAAWRANIELFQDLTDISQGVRRLGAASVDLCHVALGSVEATWEYRLKPWDVTGGAIILTEAGGKLTDMCGGEYRAMGASSPSSSLVSTAVPLKELLEVAQKAAAAGAVVVGDALDKPRTVTFKGATDLVTETDKAAEVAVLQYIRREFPHHGVLGEEGGVAGNTASEYLWVVDPIDGTTNFAHSYAGFAVSVGVLHNGKPVAGCVIEFVGGMHAWNTRTYAAHSGGGATCNGKPIHVSSVSTIERSLLVTGFGYEHDAAWRANIELFQDLTDISQGVRRLGAASVDLCHVALGSVEATWEYRLKPWDVTGGAIILTEAGGKLTDMCGGEYSVFSRSLLGSNGLVHDKLLDHIAPKTQALIDAGIDLSPWKTWHAPLHTPTP